MDVLARVSEATGVPADLLSGCLPALASAHLSGVHSTPAFAVIVAAGMAAYALLARLRDDRQLLHDVLCGTQLVDTRNMPAAPAQSVA